MKLTGKIRKEATKLMYEKPSLNLTNEQAVEIIRWSINKYVGVRTFADIKDEDE